VLRKFSDTHKIVMRNSNSHMADMFVPLLEGVVA